MAVVSISLPDELLRQADAVVARGSFAGRSELARAALREYLAGEDKIATLARRSASLMIVYAHGHERLFSSLRHAYLDITRTSIHSHAGDTCVEIFVLDGASERILSFEAKLQATREALRVHLVYTDMAGVL